MNPYTPPTHFQPTSEEPGAALFRPRLCRLYLLASVAYFLVIAIAAPFHTFRPGSDIPWLAVRINEAVFGLIHIAFLIALARAFRQHFLWIVIAAQLLTRALLFFQEPFGQSTVYSGSSLVTESLLAFAYFRLGAIFSKRTLFRRLSAITLGLALLTPGLKYFDAKAPARGGSASVVPLVLFLTFMILIIWEFKLRFSIFWSLRTEVSVEEETSLE